MRLAGLPESAAATFEGDDGWRWARANLPEVEACAAGPAGLVPLTASSGAAYAAAAAGADFLGAVEGESRLASLAHRTALASDASMAAWLAAGAAAAGARAWAELSGSAASAEPAARWCAQAGVPLVLLEMGPEASWGMDAAGLSMETERAFSAAALGLGPARLKITSAALEGFEAAGFLAAEPGRITLPASSALRSSPSGSGRAGSGLAEALGTAAAAAAFGLEKLFVFSSAGPLAGLDCHQAWGLGEGAVPAAAGARFFARDCKCVAICPPPRGMALGWLLHAAARNADLTVVAAVGDAAAAETARVALETAGVAFFARLRPADGAPAVQALKAAMRHRGLAFLVVDETAPTAVLRDGVRPLTWEETRA